MVAVSCKPPLRTRGIRERRLPDLHRRVQDATKCLRVKGPTADGCTRHSTASISVSFAPSRYFMITTGWSRDLRNCRRLREAPVQVVLNAYAVYCGGREDLTGHPYDRCPSIRSQRSSSRSKNLKPVLRGVIISGAFQRSSSSIYSREFYWYLAERMAIGSELSSSR
ncbi:hypothetical protein OH76DRAFT_1408414 [Lentinus brumalis]|uniref:Uncharacterized protein n=1 Tax=Lentinus brumalis TaxID=2498619 RepID=A0A371CXW5_9APHY|nr:hypothetical protein OH76DRAFT_1408414 [Polyporus brumalis]